MRAGVPARLVAWVLACAGGHVLSHVLMRVPAGTCSATPMPGRAGLCLHLHDRAGLRVSPARRNFERARIRVVKPVAAARDGRAYVLGCTVAPVERVTCRGLPSRPGSRAYVCTSPCAACGPGLAGAERLRPHVYTRVEAREGMRLCLRRGVQIHEVVGCRLARSCVLGDVVRWRVASVGNA